MEMENAMLKLVLVYAIQDFLAMIALTYLVQMIAVEMDYVSRAHAIVFLYFQGQIVH
jgi:hypothetical protein